MATDLLLSLESRPGVLAGIGDALGAAGVNLDGFSAVVADGQGYVHLLVENGGEARAALESAGFEVTAEHDAIVVEPLEDRPGALGVISGKLAAAGVNIESGYLATRTRLVLVVDDPDRARQAL